MIKLNILNMKAFLKAVNECRGDVNLLEEDGGRENINKEYVLQRKLMEEYEEGRKSLCLCLDIPDGHDYMNIISYYVGDC